VSRRRRRRQTGREFLRELLIDLALRAFFVAFMFIVVMPLVLLWAQNFKLHISTPSPRAPIASTR